VASGARTGFGRECRHCAKSNVKYPNVNTLVEMSDLRDAQRSSPS
jgi:flagellar basal body rod protein FlgC